MNRVPLWCLSHRIYVRIFACWRVVMQTVSYLGLNLLFFDPSPEKTCLGHLNVLLGEKINLSHRTKVCSQTVRLQASRGSWVSIREGFKRYRLKKFFSFIWIMIIKSTRDSYSNTVTLFPWDKLADGWEPETGGYIQSRETLPFGNLMIQPYFLNNEPQTIPSGVTDKTWFWASHLIIYSCFVIRKIIVLDSCHARSCAHLSKLVGLATRLPYGQLVLRPVFLRTLSVRTLTRYFNGWSIKLSFCTTGSA